MTKGATEVAASVGDEETVTAEAMLRSLTFQQRLDQARAQRERALQARGQDELSPATLSKPWEKPLPARDPAGGTQPSRRLERTAPTLFFPSGSAPAPVANLANSAAPAPEAARAASRSPAPAAHRWPALPKSGFLRTAIGFSLGLGLGLGIALLARQPDPTATTASPPSAAAPATGVASGRTSPPADDAALSGAMAAARPLAGPGQPDVALITPASVEARPMPSLAAAPAAAAPETPPDRPMATAATAPSIWWPEAAGLPSVAGEQVPSTPPLDTETIIAARPPSQIGPAPQPDALSRYGQESRQQPVADPLLPYAGLSVKILSAAAADTPSLTALATTLRDAGFPAAAIGQVSYRISQTHVRYYYAADAEAAAAIAGRLGTGARDFSQAAPLPPEGLIEVWVAPPSGGDAQVAPPAEATPKPVPVKTATKKKAAAKNPPKAPAPDVTEDAEAARVKARILLLLQGSGTP